MITYIRKVLGSGQYPFNSLVFIIGFCFYGTWSLIAFFYAFALDEGTLSNSGFDMFMANSFNFLRLPTHPILIFISEYVPIVSILYFPALGLNVYLFARITERLWVILIGTLRPNSST